MIFRSELVSAQWDTWCYYHEGLYYLYYLITEHSPGEGFGVASSPDGVHWTDHGWAIKASDLMVRFLGTGSVWPDPARQGQFLCNYSEFRLDESGQSRQCILFAASEDLIHWTKCGDEHVFWIDERYYERYGRWDCIFALPRPQGGYFGTWTATPAGRASRNGGIGFGVSADGLRWQALPCIEVVPDADESGAIVQAGGRVHAMFGSFGRTTEAGMHAYVADGLDKPYRLAGKNSCLLKAAHSYFSRYVETPDGVLINHHAMDGCKNDHGRRITYFAPFKKFAVDPGGVQRWLWWPGNEALKGPPAPPQEPLDFQRGVVLEASLGPGAGQGYSELHIEVDDLRFIVRLTPHGEMTVLGHDPQQNTDVELLKASRHLNQGGDSQLRLLARRGMLELYLGDYFMECCALGCPDAQRIRCTFSGPANGSPVTFARAWQMDL